jgi:hypothetical protein
MKRRPLALLRSALGPALILFALSCGSASAAVTVNTTTDSNAAGGCAGLPGDCSLRQALAKASAGETVIVPAGTHTLTFGSLGIGQAVTVQGAGARTTSVVRVGGPSSNVFNVASPGLVTISGLTISAGQVPASESGFLHGGAVYNQLGSALALESVAITGTTLEKTDGASGTVRGVGVANNGTLTIANSTLSGNVGIAAGAQSGNQGAGLFNSGGTVSILNTTIAGNSHVETSGADSSGSAISNVNGGAVELRNVTIAANGGSAAIDSSDGLSATNTIVSNGASGNCSGPVTSQGHNLESADECGFNAAGDQTGKDPLLGALADNGGQTNTLALLAGSPALDAGDPAACPASDQRGVARPQGPACDIGAFEAEPAAAIPSNAFKFGKLKRNKRRGTATLVVILPGPGTLTLRGKGVVGRQPGDKAQSKASKAVGAAGRVRLLIRSEGRAKRRLARRGRVKVKLKVTYTPTGGAANTKTKSVKLVKRG